MRACLSGVDVRRADVHDWAADVIGGQASRRHDWPGFRSPCRLINGLGVSGIYVNGRQSADGRQVEPLNVAEPMNIANQKVSNSLVGKPTQSLQLTNHGLLMEVRQPCCRSGVSETIAPPRPPHSTSALRAEGLGAKPR